MVADDIARGAQRLARLGEGLRRGSTAISPTAYYTGSVWAHHGLGDPRLVPPVGRALWLAGQPVRVPLDLLGGPTLVHFLLARHRIIDHLLQREIEDGRVGTVVELACGLSPRGLRMTQHHPDLAYVEVDLPDIAERKQRALERIGALSDRHRVAAVDVFGDDVPDLFRGLDHAHGVAVVSEGLLNYFPTDRVELLWERVAAELQHFPSGCYFSDLHLAGEAGPLDRAFAVALGVFVRGRVHFHYSDAGTAEAALRSRGFADAQLHRPEEYAEELPGMDAAGADRVRVLEART